MRSKMDHRMRSMLRRVDKNVARVSALGETAEVALDEAEAQDLTLVEFLARATEPVVAEKMESVGAQIWTVVPGPSTIIAGRTSEPVLEALTTIDGLERLELSRPMGGELNVSRDDARIGELHVPPDGQTEPVRGAGAIVGIIDGGIDYRHPSFRNSDGSSRILNLWDQRTFPQPGTEGTENTESTENAVPFGREYTKADLDAALESSSPLDEVPHRDTGGHGTHVAGIAAGNGRAGNAFRGVAPDADLIVVASRSDGDTLGRSASSLAAYQFISERAGDRPVAINQSQGMNGGGHAGETLLETGIDNLLRRPGIVAVKSAGNEQQMRIHAGGRIAEGDTVRRRFRIEQDNSIPAVFELWYSDEDEIAVSIQPPGEPALGFVGPDDGELEFETQAGNEIFVQFERDADDSGSTLATIEISPHNSTKLRPGRWRLRLRGDRIERGRFDLWIERAPRPGGSRRFQARFSSGSADNTRTITTPGTAQRIITAGSYITKSSTPLGAISPFSSRGPTRDGRQKPDLAAPGQFIVSARSSDSQRPPESSALLTSMPGTSMAAPHVTGVAALVLSLRPELDADQVRQLLARSSRTDFLSDDAPDDTWGAGKLQAGSAVELARDAAFPVISDIESDGTELRWSTDIPASATVRFHTSLRRLLLGQELGTEANLGLDTQQTIDLRQQEPGTYFCEILAFGEDGLRTVSNDQGQGHIVEVV